MAYGAKIPVPAATLVEMYTTKEMSLEEIAQQFNVSRQAIYGKIKTCEDYDPRTKEEAYHVKARRLGRENKVKMEVLITKSQFDWLTKNELGATDRSARIGLAVNHWMMLQPEQREIVEKVTAKKYKRVTIYADKVQWRFLHGLGKAKSATTRQAIAAFQIAKSGLNGS